MNLQRIARGLEVAYFGGLSILKVFDLINKGFSELRSLDLVLEHDFLLYLIGNNGRPARGSICIFLSCCLLCKLDLSLLVFFAFLLPGGCWFDLEVIISEH